MSQKSGVAGNKKKPLKKNANASSMSNRSAKKGKKGAKDKDAPPQI